MYLVEALQSYMLQYPEEIPTAEAMIDFALRDAGCFERSTIEGHFTGSAWILHPEQHAVLLTHHRKLNKWMQLGGHADGESDLLRVSTNEAIEESGILNFEVLDANIFDIDIHTIPARASDPQHLHFDVRYIFKATSAEYVVSAESHDLGWIPLDAIHEYSDEHSIARMASKSRRYYRG